MYFRNIYCTNDSIIKQNKKLFLNKLYGKSGIISYTLYNIKFNNNKNINLTLTTTTTKNGDSEIACNLEKMLHD